MWLVKQKQPTYHSLENLFDFPLFSDVSTPASQTSELHETSDNLYLSVVLPGVKKEDVTIEFLNEYITIDVKSHEDKHADQENIAFSKVSARFNLKQNFYVGEIDSKNIQATLKDGILSLVLPKKEQQKPKEILIN